MIAIPISLLMLCSASAHAQSGVPLWTNRYSAGSAQAIAVDGSGNVFVTGTSWNGTNSDYATIKYSSAGVPLWSRRYAGPGNSFDRAGAIAVDSSGNVLVTGSSGDGGLSANDDYATVAYSNAGVPLWTNRYDGPANDRDSVHAIAVDSSGNVFVTGTSSTIVGPPFWNRDYATIAYSNAGVPLWTNRYDGPANRDEQARGIAVDSSGNVFVTGSSHNDDGVADFATVAYSSAGDLLWSDRYDGPGPGNDLDAASAIAVDSSGNVFVTGESYDPATFSDYATVSYSSGGVPLWIRRYNGPVNGGDYPEAIAVDNTGNVFVTGFSIGANGYPNYDYATIKYSSTGVPLWSRRYAGPGNSADAARAIAVDSSGNVFVTGSSGDGMYDNDYATAAYSSAGVPLWTNRYNGPGNGDDNAYAIAVDRNGNVFVTGASWNGTNSDTVTIKYSSSVPPPRLDFQLLSNELVLSWTNAAFNLQTAPTVTGPFINLSGATSPYTHPLTAPQQFFRLCSN